MPSEHKISSLFTHSRWRRAKIRNSDKVLIGKIRQAYLHYNTPLYQKRESIQVTSHLDRIVNNEKALDQKLRRCYYVTEKIGVSGKRIIDFGSGLGFLSCFLAAHGAHEVVGIEVVEESIMMSSFLANEVFGVSNVRFLISINQLHSESYDAVLLNNVISHIDHPFSLLRDLSLLLKPNGLLYIEDNNNYKAFLVRKRNRHIWSRADKQYQQRRETFIRKRFGRQLNEAEARSLAAKTYGLDYDSITWWLQQHLRNGLSLSHLELLKSRAPIDPDRLIYHENSFTPSEVETILFNLGFAILASHPKYVFDFKEHRLISFLFHFFPHISSYFAPAFEIVALKTRKLK
jgi:2-polyprenyl-3-methyl-5-hydroxy-6-metoxy-1,4-benzoquinol methylase